MKRSTAGFTLLEMLVVLSLLAVLLTLIGTALVSANRSLQRAEVYGQRLDEVRATQNFLRRAFGQALPLAADGSEDRPGAVFEGDEQQANFYAPLPATLGGGLYQYRLALKGRRLQVVFARLQAHGLQPATEAVVLLHQVQALRLSYRGFDAKGKATDWLPSWPWPARLPRQVRIDAQLAGPVPWPQQTVALRLDLSGQAGAL